MNSSEQLLVDEVSLNTNKYEYLTHQKFQASKFNSQQKNINNINSESSIYTLWARIFGLLILASLLFVVAL